MDAKVSALIEGAKMVSVGMIKVASTKPNDAPLQSNAQTFRGAANMLNALSLEVAKAEEKTAEYRAKLERIANLKVRGAAEAIGASDWKNVVSELQAVAQDALAPGSVPSASREPRSVPRR